MSLTRIQILTDLVVSGKASADELFEFAAWVEQHPENTAFTEVLQQAFVHAKADLPMPEGMRDRILSSIIQQQSVVPVRSLRKASMWKWAAAAAVILLAGTGIVYLLQPRKADLVADNKPVQIVQPGQQGAILTLADGRQVVLDSLGNGIIADEKGTRVILKDGQLAYDASQAAATGFNKISTPAGRQYQVVLPDGSKVWLNAGSSLKYPTTFAGAERKVEMTGEAYFEIAKDAKRKFRVSINDRDYVDVLGTDFNIKAYVNESDIQTTLLQGSVKVASGVQSLHTALLKPGQQARMAQPAHATKQTSAAISVLDQVNTEAVMAWKNNRFNFEGMSLQEIMRQLERWYNIEVVYEGTAPGFGFYGELSRNNTLNDILEAFKDSDLRFRLEGRKLFILK